MKFAPKTILKKKYKIDGLVGSGGYGFVYKAADVYSGRVVSIKQIANISREFENQFDTEVNILRKIRHNNIPNLSMIIESFKENDSLFIVMEYIDGHSLKEMVETEGNLSLPVSLNIILQVGSALHSLHELERFPILHRDVNPSNILLQNDGTATLIDFGLVKEDQRQETMDAAKAITPGFSAVEQYGSGLTDVRSDIYSLGTTLYFLLSGEIPQESVQRVERDNFAIQIEKLTHIPPKVISSIKRATGITSQDRYQSMNDFLIDIKECWKDLPNLGQNGDDNISFDKGYKTDGYSVPSKDSVLKFDSNASVEAICDENGYANFIKWEKLKYPGILYLIVKKHLSRPENQNDGKTVIMESSPFIDRDVENGVLVYYVLFALHESSIARCTTNLPSIMRMDDVYNLRAERGAKSEILIDFELPKNVKQVIIKKSVSKKPLHLYDGSLVFTLEKILENEKIVQFTDGEAERLPVYYSVFCRYQIKRSTLLTSKGNSILV